MNYEFKINKTTTPKQKPDIDHLEFGTTFTDHMFIMNYSEGKGWHDGRIVPYAPIELDPAAAVLHYAQEMFEGLKAYKAKDGRVLLFVRYECRQRLQVIELYTRIDEELYVEAIKAVMRWTQTDS